MRIVVDTNVIISGTFFSGKPKEVVDAIADRRVSACASPAILEEYNDTVKAIIHKGYGDFDAGRFSSFVERLDLIEPVSSINACRDPDDDKFISCAVDAKAVFIVSGDKDLLDIGQYGNVEIITAADFCRRYL